MNIIKVGGSIINPDGKYDNKVAEDLISLIKSSKEKFILVIGGGKLCRKVQEAAMPFLKEALGAEISYANDSLGIAITKINAQYLLNFFQKKMGEEVYPEILLDPTQKVKAKHRVFFIGGWKPGHSTDKDLMLLAKTFKAERIIKLSNFDVVKEISPLEILHLPEEEEKRRLAAAKELPRMTWKELKDLVGTKWVPGLNTPFDPRAVEEGYKMRNSVTLYIGRREELPKMLSGGKFKGTIVKG